MTVPARISLVTLGVADLGRSVAFYDALGWERVGEPEGVAFYRTAGALLSLYPTSDLARDARVAPDGAGFRAVTLAVNVASREEVDAAFAHLAEIGATILAPPEAVFWGGYIGYFADPDGHAWEVAHNPAWPLDERGLPVID